MAGKPPKQPKAPNLHKVVDNDDPEAAPLHPHTTAKPIVLPH